MDAIIYLYPNPDVDLVILCYIKWLQVATSLIYANAISLKNVMINIKNIFKEHNM